MSTSEVSKTSSSSPPASSSRPSSAPASDGAAAQRTQGAPSSAPAHHDTADHSDVESLGHSHPVDLSGWDPGHHQGEKITHGKDGRVTDSYTQGGAQVTQTRYTRDGATVTESRKSYHDGRVYSTDVVDKNGIVETTRSNSRPVDKPIGEVAPHQKPDGEFGDSLTTNPTYGKPGPTMVTHTTKTVQDTNEPGEPARQLEASTSYRQFTPIHGAFEGGDGNTSFDLTTSTNFVPQLGSGFNFDPKGQSGRVDAVTVTTMRNGQPVDHVESGSRETIAWKYQGKDVTTVHDRQAQFDNGKKGPESNTIELQGYQDLSSLQAGGDAKDNQKFTDLVDPAQGYRGPQGMRFTQTSLNGKVVDTAQFGDINNSSKIGSRTITEQNTFADDENKDVTQWTARKVDAPADGQPGYRVRTQTNTEGSNGYVLDDTTVRPNGDSAGKTQVFDGKSDQPVIEQSRTREHVTAADVANQSTLGDPASNAAFLKANGHSQLFETSVVEINRTGKGQGYSLSHTYTAQGSQDQLGYLGSSKDVPHKPGEFGYTTVLERPGTATPQRLTSPDGTVLTTDRSGNLLARNKQGQEASLGTVAGLDPLSLTGSGGGAFKDIYHSLSQEKLPPGFVGGSGLVNAFSGLNSLGGSTSDNLSGASSLSGGVADLSEAASKLTAEGGSLDTLLSGGSDVLGTAGGVLGIAGGAFQIANGDPVQGGFSVAAGVGTTAAGAAGLGLLGEGAVAAAVPGIGWGIAGVAVAGSIIYTLLQDDPDPYQSADLKI